MANQAEIHMKVVSEDARGRIVGIEQLRSNFTDLHDKDSVWKKLHRLTLNKKCVER